MQWAKWQAQLNGKHMADWGCGLDFLAWPESQPVICYFPCQCFWLYLPASESLGELMFHRGALLWRAQGHYIWTHRHLCPLSNCIGPVGTQLLKTEGVHLLTSRNCTPNITSNFVPFDNWYKTTLFLLWVPWSGKIRHMHQTFWISVCVIIKDGRR